MFKRLKKIPSLPNEEALVAELQELGSLDFSGLQELRQKYKGDSFLDVYGLAGVIMRHPERKSFPFFENWYVPKIPEVLLGVLKDCVEHKKNWDNTTVIHALNTGLEALGFEIKETPSQLMEYTSYIFTEGEKSHLQDLNKQQKSQDGASLISAPDSLPVGSLPRNTGLAEAQRNVAVGGTRETGGRDRPSGGRAGLGHRPPTGTGDIGNGGPVREDGPG